MRLQLESFAEKVFRLVDEEFEMDTTEGMDIYKALMVAMFKKFTEGKIND